MGRITAIAIFEHIRTGAERYFVYYAHYVSGSNGTATWCGTATFDGDEEWLPVAAAYRLKCIGNGDRGPGTQDFRMTFCLIQFLRCGRTE